MNMKRIAIAALCAPGVLMADIKDEIPPWLLGDEAVAPSEPTVPVREDDEYYREEICEPTPELFDEVAAYIRERMAALFPTVKGGPGLSEETAWVLGADVYPDPQLLRSVLPDDYEEFDSANLLGENGHTYFVVLFHLNRDGKVYEFTYWVDTEDAALVPTDDEEVNEDEEAEEGAVDVD